MNFEDLAQLFERLEKTSSGNEIRGILAEFFRDAARRDAGDIKIVVYLCLGNFGPEHDNVVLGLAERTALKAVARAGGVSEKNVGEMIAKMGDVGLVAERVMVRRPKLLMPAEELSVRELYDGLVKISSQGGAKSNEVKIGILVGMLVRCTPLGAKYVVRTAVGNMRLGVAEKSIIDALAMAFVGEKGDRSVVERAYNVCPDLGEIAERLAKGGRDGIKSVKVKVGRPVKMMLAQRVESLDEVEKKMPGKVLVEAKYDGERVQVHKLSTGEVRLFSRRLDTISEQFPELVEQLRKGLKCKSCIVEGEILALGEDGRPRPFQVLMQRRRKYDVQSYAEKVPVVLKLFDVLAVDSEVLLESGLEERKKVLESIVRVSDMLQLSENIESDDAAEMDRYFRAMLKRGYEGIILKSLDGRYQAGARGWSWIKWKKEYCSELSDSFDLIVAGAFFGRGKRKGMYGALLCCVLNSSTGKFESFCKLGTGLTDEVLESLPEVLDKYRREMRPENVVSGMGCDVWFEPKVVVEVAGAEVTRSPIHASGYALRFPRFVRFREKRASDATTIEEVEGMVRREMRVNG